MRCLDSGTLASQAMRRVRKRTGPVEPYRDEDVFERDDWRCQVPMCLARSRRIDRRLLGTAKWGPTIDHLVPVSEGGPDAPANVRAAHRYCNTRQGARGGGQLRLVG